MTPLTVLWFSTGQTSKIVVTEIYSKSVFIPFIILFPNRLVTSTAIKIAPALKNLMYLLMFLGLHNLCFICFSILFPLSAFFLIIFYYSIFSLSTDFSVTLFFLPLLLTLVLPRYFYFFFSFFKLKSS